jgi:hypothetical protein
MTFADKLAAVKRGQAARSDYREAEVMELVRAIEEEQMEEQQSGMGSVLKVLDNAECKLVDDKRCFVISLTDFYRVIEILAAHGVGGRTDDKLQRTHGLDNIEFRMSVLEKEVYYICAKTEPLLDRLWEAKFKK